MTEADPAADDWQLVQQAHYDRDERRDLTTAIICAIAAVEGVAPDEVKEPNLYECTDVDAIENCLFGREVGSHHQDGSGSIVFRFDEYRIKVVSDGWISIYTATPTTVETYLEPSQRPSVAVKQVIAELEGCRPSQLGTLSNAIAPDELDAVVDRSHTDSARHDFVSFGYCGYSVYVSSNRLIHIKS